MLKPVTKRNSQTPLHYPQLSYKNNLAHVSKPENMQKRILQISRVNISTIHVNKNESINTIPVFQCHLL